MADDPSPEEEREFDLLIERAGLKIPPDRRAGTLAGMAEARLHVKRVWDCATNVEPIMTFKLKPMPRRNP
jgi:hypothetical protein